MEDDGFRKRIGEYMARGNELLVELREQNARGDARGYEFLAEMRAQNARSNEYMVGASGLMAEVLEELQLSRQERAEAGAEHSDLREFIREMTLRIERGTQTMVAELRDLQDQTRANTAAVLAMLDRFNGPGQSGATA